MVVRVAVMVGVVIVGLVKLAPSAVAPATAEPAGTGGDTATAVRPHVVGPRLVALGDSAEIDLPAGMILYERVEAQRFLRGIGEPAEGVVAIVLAPDAEWTAILSYAGAGYIDDADASELDAGALLADYSAGNRAQNERRRVLGAPELAIDGWAEPPRYERAQHRLAWGLAAHTVDGPLANLFTRILGRDGYVSVSLIDTAETIERSKLQARSILDATRFRPGARYQDHAPGDRRAGSGLRGLVRGTAGGAVASQLGILSQTMLALRKASLLLLVGGLGVAELARRLRRRRLRGKTAVRERITDATDAAGPSVDVDRAGVDEALDVLVARRAQLAGGAERDHAALVEHGDHVRDAERR